MTTATMPTRSGRRLRGLPLAAVLALALVAGLWAATYFGAEARMGRATAKVVRLAEKTGEESPVALGLAAHRFGNFLATNAVLELKGYGPLATGRTEIVQLFANVRNALDEISFAEPRIAAVALRRGEVQVFVEARYRLAGAEAGAAQAGRGKADLRWLKGEEGWKIARAALTPDPAAPRLGRFP